MDKKETVIDFDFGFSFIDDEIEEEKSKLQTEVQSTTSKAEDLDTRLQMLYNSVVPFLDNLCQNPEKSTIYWPNRVEKIAAYKKKLLSIVEGN